MDEFAACWDGLDDPRTGNAGLHDFHELLFIALCSVLCGGQGAVDMALFAKSKELFLRGVLTLANGTPNHDTFSRLFRQLDPEASRAVFGRFVAGFPEQCRSLAPGAAPGAVATGVVATDGKVLRRSFERAGGKSARLLVSAWGCEQRLVLAQVATDAKSNEITAVPALLRLLSLQGTIVTADALHCQRATARQIVEQGGDYALALKGNQGTLHDDVVRFLDDPASEAATTVSRHARPPSRPTSTGCRSGTSGRGWPPSARCTASARPRPRRRPKPPTTCSAPHSPPDRLNEVARSHWGTEN